MDTVRPFTDLAAVASYGEDARRKVPGYFHLHRMAMLLLAERAPSAANILVYGAGGGLELRAFAEAQPGWHLTGVDPSAPMLDLARQVAEPHLPRIDLVHGFIDDVPSRHFDGATCLLTMHFLEPQERLRVLRAIRQRLKPGSALVVAHHSYPQSDGPNPWLTRSVAFGSRDERSPAAAASSAAAMVERLPLLSDRDEERLLAEAGYSDVSLFYAAFSFRGWCAIA